MDRTVVTSDDVVYRTVQEETLVVQLESGEIFHFTPKTFEFLEAFKQPRKLGSDGSKDIRDFCQLLLDKQILRESTEGGSAIPDRFEDGLAFLRKDDRNIDDIVFLCP